MARKNRVRRAFVSGKNVGKKRRATSRAYKPRPKKSYQTKVKKVPFGGTRGVRQDGSKNKDLRVQYDDPNRCQTSIDGKMVWAAAKDKAGNKIVRNGKVVRYPVIVDALSSPDDPKPTKRCPNPATTSRMRNGVTEKKCASHIGVWYVDPDGVKHNYDNEPIS